MVTSVCTNENYNSIFGRGLSPMFIVLNGHARRTNENYNSLVGKGLSPMFIVLNGHARYTNENYNDILRGGLSPMTNENYSTDWRNGCRRKLF